MKKYCLSQIVNVQNTLKTQHPYFASSQFFLILLIVFNGFLSSCEEDPNQLGSNIFPNSDSFEIKYDSTVQVSFSQQISDSLSTHKFLGQDNYYNPILENSSNLLGDYYDNVFGRISSSVLFRFYSPGYYKTKLSAWQPELCTLFLLYDTTYVVGSPISNLQFKIYKVDTTINKVPNLLFTKQYFSSFNPNSYLGKELQMDAYSIKKDTISFPIKDLEFMKFLTSIDTADRRTYKKFYTAFNGLYITAQSKAIQGGTIMSLNMLKGAIMKLKCKNGTSDTTIIYDVSPYLGGISVFKHDFSNSEILTNSNYIFLEGMAGPKGLLDISDIKRWRKTIPGNIAINRAELYLHTDTSFLQTKDIPSSLFRTSLSLMIKTDTTEQRVPDQNIDAAYFNGTYNNGKYSFNITNYIQSIIKKSDFDTKQHSLVLRVSNGVLSAKRTAFKKTTPVRLRITYSILK